MFGFSTSETLTQSRQGAGISKNGNTWSSCAPILSGVVGVMADKCLPLSLSDDIRLEFTLESAVQGMVYQYATTSNPWSVISFELELNIIELSDYGMQMVNSIASPEKPIYLHGKSYRHYVSSLPSGTAGSYSTLVSARFASLCGLICAPRRATEISQYHLVFLSIHV
jgi:hypothetical protein